MHQCPQQNCITSFCLPVSLTPSLAILFFKVSSAIITRIECILDTRLSGVNERAQQRQKTTTQGSGWQNWMLNRSFFMTGLWRHKSTFSSHRFQKVLQEMKSSDITFFLRIAARECPVDKNKLNKLIYRGKVTA